MLLEMLRKAESGTSFIDEALPLVRDRLFHEALADEIIERDLPLWRATWHRRIGALVSREGTVARELLPLWLGWWRNTDESLPGWWQWLVEQVAESGGPNSDRLRRVLRYSTRPALLTGVLTYRQDAFGRRPVELSVSESSTGRFAVGSRVPFRATEVLPGELVTLGSSRSLADMIVLWTVIEVGSGYVTLTSAT